MRISSSSCVCYVFTGVALRHSIFEFLAGFELLKIAADSYSSQVFTQFVIHSWHLAHDIQNERIILQEITVGGKKATDV